MKHYFSLKNNLHSNSHLVVQDFLNSPLKINFVNFIDLCQKKAAVTAGYPPV